MTQSAHKKNFTFINQDGREIKYEDVLNGKFLVTNTFDETAIVKAGKKVCDGDYDDPGFSWVYELYRTKCPGRNPTDEYLKDEKKVRSSNWAFDFYESKVGRLNKDSKVIEFGCCLARNLRVAHQRYSCFCEGIDVTESVIKENQKYFKEKGSFHKANLSGGGKFLRRYKDNEFDLGISFAFLMCFPAFSKEKKELINEILRICKTCWFSEGAAGHNGFPYDENRIQRDYNEKDNGCQTFEHLSEYDSRIKMIEGIPQCNFQSLYIFNKQL